MSVLRRALFRLLHSLPRMLRHRSIEAHGRGLSFLWLEDARRDLHYAARTLARTPAFTALAVLTLAIGIGSITIIYSVIHDLVLHPLPYRGSERFVNIAIVDADTGRRRTVLTPDEFLDVQEHATVFEAVFGTLGSSAILKRGESAELLRVVRVTPNFFEVMGLPPLLGRTLDERDVVADAEPVAVLRHRAWVTHFAADPNVIGRVIHLDGVQRTIIGVMPERFTWHAADLWIPGPIRRQLGDAAADPRNCQARLKSGVVPKDAEVQLNTIAQRWAQANPAAYPAHVRVEVVNVIEQVVGDFKGVLYTALGAVGLLLLIACSNVANMLLVKAAARQREMTIRTALGAGRSRIIRQVLTESVILGLAGASAGVLLAYIGIGALVPFLPRGPLPGEVEFGLDRGALFFTVAVAGFSALLFGIAPALYSTRRDLGEALKAGGRSVSAGSGRVRQALVVAGIALSLVLVVSAGLLMRSFIALVRVDLGFDPRPILVRLVTFPRDAYSTPAERQRLYADALQRILAVPGVADAAASTGIPPFGAGVSSEVEIAGKAPDPQRIAAIHFCTSRYFRTVGISIVRGQPFRDEPTDRPERYAIVNQTLAASYFRGSDAVGQHIAIKVPTGVGAEQERQSYEVIGVVTDVRNRGPREHVAPQVYLPAPALIGNPVLLVRTAADPATVTAAVRAAIRGTNRYAIVGEPGTVEQILGTAVYAQPRFSLLVTGLFAGTGTLLIAIGVFSVMAYTVAQRTREIAVRIALGATRAHVTRLVFSVAGQLLLIGLGVGLFLSFIAARLLARQLWGVSAHDPGTAMAACGIVSFVAILACYVPARRAIRTDPIATLRLE